MDKNHCWLDFDTLLIMRQKEHLTLSGYGGDRPPSCDVLVP